MTFLDAKIIVTTYAIVFVVIPFVYVTVKGR